MSPSLFTSYNGVSQDHLEYSNELYPTSSYSPIDTDSSNASTSHSDHALPCQYSLQPSYESDSESLPQEQASVQPFQRHDPNPWIVRHYTTEEVEAFEQLMGPPRVDTSAFDHLVDDDSMKMETGSSTSYQHEDSETSGRSVYELLSGCRRSSPVVEQNGATRVALVEELTRKGWGPVLIPSTAIYTTKEAYEQAVNALVSLLNATYSCVEGADAYNRAVRELASDLLAKSPSAQSSQSSENVRGSWDFVEKTERDGVVEMKQVEYKIGMKGFLRLLV